MAKEQPTKPRRQLPEVGDPYDMAAKRRLNPKADEKNFIDDRGRLVCGGRKPKRGENAKCRSLAGAGTKHKGYGRCKFCGGMNTGPKTPEGKAKCSQNSRKHGFYAQTLKPDEQEAYESLREGKSVSLEEEIYLMKAKILVYLQEARDKHDRALAEAQKNPQQRQDEAPEERARRAIRVYYTTGLEQERAYYHQGTADDKVLTRQLDLLRRLVDSQAKLNPNQQQGMLDSINQELRAASHGTVTMEWGQRPPQRRADREEEGSE